MKEDVLRFDKTWVTQALKNCDGKFSAIAALTAAERFWPFLKNYLQHVQADGLRDFRNLIDASWALISENQAGLSLAKKSSP